MMRLEYQTHRVKFGFGRTNRAELFEEFARYNARLRELLDTSDQSAALKQSRQQIRNSAVKKILWKIWRHAASLHDLLGQAWCCQCKHLHRACLLLHHETNVKRIEFSICFLYAPNLVADRCPWRWKEVNAQHINHDISESNMSLEVFQNFMPQSPVPKPPSKSSMRDPNLSTLPSRPRVSWTNTPPPVVDSTPRATGPTVITDLCSTIASCDPASNIFGLLEGDEDSYILQRGAKTKPPGQAYQTVSLESLLNRSSGFLLDHVVGKTSQSLSSLHHLGPSPTEENALTVTVAVPGAGKGGLGAQTRPALPSSPRLAARTESKIAPVVESIRKFSFRHRCANCGTRSQ
ncbi:hypothetical protein HO173_007068 [Letharia columbiana]|uniref:Uncharacterized protein n=1 Tax=Letharia columbiana TaxID=112416 RepID=A0A8H6FU56_9LECA|nr:uncharacterized protein HO173_007068 [Letharia columbiana]KAF6234848.1 hypothetical protein HO173_007068 [Letharia columbiana]